jgi:hypothetical protein
MYVRTHWRRMTSAMPRLPETLLKTGPFLSFCLGHGIGQTPPQLRRPSLLETGIGFSSPHSGCPPGRHLPIPLETRRPGFAKNNLF